MNVICFAFGIIVGGGAMYFIERKGIHKKEEVLDGAIKSYQKATTQITNFLNYNGSSIGQEDVD